MINLKDYSQSITKAVPHLVETVIESGSTFSGNRHRKR